MRLLISSSLLFTLCTASIAAICPSVQTLKSNQAKNWQAFDSDNGKPLSAVRETRLKLAITQFALAEWSSTKDKNRIHCYYKSQNGSNLEAYFAHHSTTKVSPSRYWYEVTGMLHCAAGVDKCQFQALPDVQRQFAQNAAGTPAGHVLSE